MVLRTYKKSFLRKTDEILTGGAEIKREREREIIKILLKVWFQRTLINFLFLYN